MRPLGCCKETVAALRAQCADLRKCLTLDTRAPYLEPQCFRTSGALSVDQIQSELRNPGSSSTPWVEHLRWHGTSDPMSPEFRLLSVASESEPLPSFRSHLPFLPSKVSHKVALRSRSAAQVRAVLADRRVTCSATMLRWTTSSWPTRDRNRRSDTVATNWLRSDGRRAPATV